MTEDANPTTTGGTRPSRWPGMRAGRPAVGRRSLALVAALIGAAAIGAGATALAQRGRVTLVALAPAPISVMRDDSAVAIKGQVADIFGNKFVVQDQGGRALVDTGRAGEGGGLVAPSETVIVQGRFERGSIHAVAVQHADGRTDMVGPPGPPLGPLPGRPPGPVAGAAPPATPVPGSP